VDVSEEELKKIIAMIQVEMKWLICIYPYNICLMLFERDRVFRSNEK
jgi:hypothetical protein